MEIPGDPTLRYLGAHADVLVILTRLSLFAQTAALLTPEQRQENAVGFIEPLQAAINEHHADEESTLFVQMIDLARDATEKETTQNLISQLIQEHRDIEATWSEVRQVLITLAEQGEHATVMPDARRCADLLARYQQHANFEETVVLPLGQSILSDSGGRSSLAPGDLRHRVDNLPGYI